MVLRKLDKVEVIPALSFPTIIEVVVYKDEEGKECTLDLIKGPARKSFGEAWMMATMMGQYAPDSIVGEVEFDNELYLGIRSAGTLYRFRKGRARCYNPFEDKHRAI